MGNSNSSSAVAQLGDHTLSSKWTESSEPPDQRNRMKRSYFQPRNNVNARHPVKVPPHKVLPPVNPSEAALRLRPTSNGAILQGGGTISGRKLLSELELDSSKVANNPTNSSRITAETVQKRTSSPFPDVDLDVDYNGYSQDINALNVSKSRNVSTTAYQNQFTSINESPSKKQIRSRKKYQAPLPPIENRSSTSNCAKGSKRLRMFKTKTEHKSNVVTSGIESGLKLKVHGSQQLKQLSEDNNDRDKNKAKAKLSSSSSHIVETEAERRMQQKNRGVPPCSADQRGSVSLAGVVSVTDKPLVSKEVKSRYSHATVQEISGHNVSERNVNKTNCLRSSYLTSSPFQNNKLHMRPENHERNDNKYEETVKKNTFYFGMDVSSLTVNKSMSPTNVQVFRVLPEEVVQFDDKGRSSRNLEPDFSNETRPSNALPKYVSKSHRNAKPESSFEDFSSPRNCAGQVDGGIGRERRSNLQKTGCKELVGHHLKNLEGNRDSSSDLSSSEMDIPPLIRPTLPLKRNELPRFSPAAAWQALESPHPSGKSISSEDGFRYENRIKRFTRPIAPIRNTNGANERSGDSGISAGDGGSPANALPRILTNTPARGACLDRQSSKRTLSSSHYKQQNPSSGSPSQCWTPQQDLDDSSSDFDQDIDTPPHYVSSVSSRLVPVSVGPQTPPKLTTLSNLFHQNIKMGINDAGTSGRSNSDFIPDEEVLGQNMSARSQLSGDSGNNNGNGLVKSSKPRQRRIPRNQLNHERKVHDFLRSDANWYLSRSEPNSLNETDLMMLSEPLDFPPKDFPPQIGEALTFDESQVLTRDVQSEIGYGPSNMNFYNDGVKNEHCSSEVESNSLILFRRPLHIMYLPSYDSRRFSSNGNQRRSKSVDNLDTSNVLFQSPRTQPQHILSRHRSTNCENINPQPHFIEHKSAAELTSNNNTAEQMRLESELISQKKAKFKFQSTLRVLERKRIEKELTQDAKERETKRLREAEDMRRVEEEFQKKRLKSLEDKLDMESQIGWTNPTETENKVVNMSIAPWESVTRNNDFKISGSENSATTSIASTSSKDHANVVLKYKKFKTTRTEPDGAPALSTASDLRKELIHASRKRNGIATGSASSDLTQELSEYRQELTRQYCDYRRNPRNYSPSPTRLLDSSVRASWNKGKNPNRGRTTVHPEVVCEIPGKRSHYIFNDSRLSGSLSNINSGDLHNSGLGARSSPSSIISDNYRRDWAHRSSCGSVLGGIDGRRASSIISLHSAPGFSSECPRNSATDVNIRPFSPPGFPEMRSQSKRHSKHTYSSRSSPVPQVSCNSSNESSIEHERDARSSKNLPQRAGVFQPQPFSNNKTKEYRPVVFNPKMSQQNYPNFAIIHSVHY